MVLAAFALSGLSCRDNPSPPVRIVLGSTPEDEVTLAPKASIAELVEVSPTLTELYLSLSSLDQGCELEQSKAEGAVSIAVRLVLPGGAKLEPGRYPLLDMAASSDKPHAHATVTWRGRRSELRGGGDIEIERLDMTLLGALQGVLKFEYAGDESHPAARVFGHFSATLCRMNRLR
jgi:hypothetical protein